jgi:hypothetical protein
MEIVDIDPVANYANRDISLDIAGMEKDNLTRLLIFNEKVNTSITEFDEIMVPIVYALAEKLPAGYELTHGYLIASNGDTYKQIYIIKKDDIRGWCTLF